MQQMQMQQQQEQPAVTEQQLQQQHRLDPIDGCAYPLYDFVAQYGGSVAAPPAEWVRASLVPLNKLDLAAVGLAPAAGSATPVAAAAAPAAPAAVPERRALPGSAALKTRQEFVDFFGSSDEWDAAEPAAKRSRASPLAGTLPHLE